MSADILCSDWKINILEKISLPKAIRFVYIPYQMARSIFHKMSKKNLQFAWRYTRPRIAKVNLKEKENGTEESGTTTSDYIQSYSHQDSIYWHKNSEIWLSECYDRKPRDKPGIHVT